MKTFSNRPIVMGTHGMVTSGHYLATATGFKIMQEGGNAIDAAAATCFAINLLEPQSNGIGGEVPTLVYSAKDKKTYAISGMGWSPKAFTFDWCRENGIDLVPGDGYLPACVPATVDTWATAVARFGTLSFSQILAPVIDLAENGYPIYQNLHDSLEANYTKYTELYPTTGDVYLKDGRVPEIGEIFRNPDWANMLRVLCRAEKEAEGKGRVAGIEAARDAFYKGPIAETIAKFISTNAVEDATGSSNTGLLSYEDMAEWNAELEEPVAVNYRGLDVHKCSSWTQGPVFLQHLNMLEEYSLDSIGHNTTEFLHIYLETGKLAFADREAYYGDPKFDSVPFETLLSKEYAAQRCSQIGHSASMELRPGKIGGEIPQYALEPVISNNRKALGIDGRKVRDLGMGHAHIGDTTHLDVVDIEGNMVSATPSGGWLGNSPIIQGLGFPIGTRGQMFYLNPERPNSLEPRKRPRATLTPSLVTKEGEPYMVFGTPGGDSQDQITLQFFLNYVDFGMNLQDALDAPTVYSTHFPSSFYPRDEFPGTLTAQNRIPAHSIEALKDRGHIVNTSSAWGSGKVTAIRLDRDHGVIHGGASSNGNIGYAFGW